MLKRDQCGHQREFPDRHIHISVTNLKSLQVAVLVVGVLLMTLHLLLHQVHDDTITTPEQKYGKFKQSLTKSLHK